MDPFGLMALVAGAGWLIKALVSDNPKKGGPKREGSGPPNSTGRQGGYTQRRNLVHRPAQKRPADALDSKIEVLPEYTLVRDLVREGFPLVFVTGGAGTGKSTFVHWLTTEFEGDVLLAAPTGIAALNINGKTLHSLCQLPPAWLTRDDIKEFRPSLAKTAKLLIIDEISMVNANLLDGVSAFFRKNRQINKPFGGLPVVMVGDLFQLPPIITEDVRPLFGNAYSSTKFFGARTLQNSPYYAVELHKAFRQVDQAFVDLLSKIREGADIAACIAAINGACAITESPAGGAVWLSPRNAEVSARNQRELHKLSGPSAYYHGKLSGKFRADRIPSPERLELRVGAQVMFTKNGGRWVNGSIGIVEKLLDDRVEVRVGDSDTVLDVGPVTWEQFDYRLNSSTGQIERTVVGEYTQIPLLLAWSITIHKSQGKTIERVHIDLGKGAFETGQTYVALSRCRSLSALTLSRALRESDVIVDAESRDFYGKLREKIRALPPEVMAAKMRKSYGTEGTSAA